MKTIKNYDLRIKNEKLLCQWPHLRQGYGGQAAAAELGCVVDGRMNLQCFILARLLLIVCVQSDHVASVQPSTTAVAPAPRTLDSFRFSWPTTTVQDVIVRLGAPNRDIGSGIYILEYRLQDG